MRLIDADALKYTMLYKENFLRGTGVEALAVWKSDVDDMPTIDAVSVIRCGECIHSDKCMILEGILEGLAYNGIHIVNRNSIARMYCPFGKRTEEEHNGE